MSGIEYARSELQRAGMFDKDSDYGGMLGDAVMKMMEVFEAEGHSGMSANLAIQIFSRLAKFEPLTPLTGEDDEWNELGTDKNTGKKSYQNKRCSHVFKEGDYAYDIQGKVFREPNGVCFTNHESRVPVTFPYMPKVEYVDVPES